MVALTGWHYAGAALIAVVVAACCVTLLTSPLWAAWDPHRGRRRDARRWAGEADEVDPTD